MLRLPVVHAGVQLSRRTSLTTAAGTGGCIPAEALRASCALCHPIIMLDTLCLSGADHTHLLR